MKYLKAFYQNIYQHYKIFVEYVLKDMTAVRFQAVSNKITVNEWFQALP